MKYSWYYIYKTANALPFDIETTKDAPKGFGLQRIDKVMKPQTAEKEGNLPYIASGENGVVVDLGNNKVRKYTKSIIEATKAQSLIGNSKYPVVKIYDVKQIQEEKDNTSKKIWAIDMEKVTPLTRMGILEREEDLIWELFHIIIQSKNEIENWPAFAYKFLCHATWNREYETEESIPDETKKRVESYYNHVQSLKSLKEINLLWDCTPTNVGINSEGRWVIFDLE